MSGVSSLSKDSEDEQPAEHQDAEPPNQIAGQSGIDTGRSRDDEQPSGSTVPKRGIPPIILKVSTTQ